MSEIVRRLGRMEESICLRIGLTGALPLASRAAMIPLQWKSAPYSFSSQPESFGGRPSIPMDKADLDMIL